MAEAVAAVTDAKTMIAGGILPLDYLFTVMRDPKNPVELRLKAAAEAAPFIHPKMPQAIIVGGEVKVEGVTVEIVAAPTGLIRR